MKRKHFYEGMRPLPDDFDVLQQNAEDAIQNTVHAITGTGVLTGLEVKQHQGLRFPVDQKHQRYFNVSKGSLVPPDKIYYDTDKNIILTILLNSGDTISGVTVGNVGIGGASEYIQGWRIRCYLDTTFIVSETNGSGFSVADDAFDGFEFSYKPTSLKNGYGMLSIHMSYTSTYNKDVYMTIGSVVISVAGGNSMFYVTPGVAVAPSGKIISLPRETKQYAGDGYILADTSKTITSYTTNIRNERVWDTQDDEMYSNASSFRGEDEVILATVKNGVLSNENREIATGWYGLKNYIDSKISDAENRILNQAIPVGFIYTQLPQQSTPQQLNWPGTWQNISSTYAGSFFRTEGGNANPFEGGKQNDAFQSHAHTYSAYEDGIEDDGHSQTNFISDKPVIKVTSEPVSFASFGYPRVANETRPINYTVRIWKRIA